MTIFDHFDPKLDHHKLHSEIADKFTRFRSRQIPGLRTPQGDATQRSGGAQQEPLRDLLRLRARAPCTGAGGAQGEGVQGIQGGQSHGAEAAGCATESRETRTTGSECSWLAHDTRASPESRGNCAHTQNPLWILAAPVT